MKRLWLIGAVELVTGCAPELEDRPDLIERPRLIAVLSEPPELRPRAEVRLTPVIASRRRELYEPSYHFCAAPPPPADPRSISEACLADDHLGLTVDPDGARGALPAEACARFGPDPVGSGFRPRDPDETGGFYQPIVIHGFGEPAVALLRIVCPLPDAPIELARAYGERYTANRNPTGLRLEQAAGQEWQSLGSVRRGEHARIRVVWDESSRERYVWLSPDGTELRERLEAINVAWFVTDGAVRAALTAVSEADPSGASNNTFDAPDHAATIQIWAVVHDSRGGTAVVRQAVTIQE